MLYIPGNCGWYIATRKELQEKWCSFTTQDYVWHVHHKDTRYETYEQVDLSWTCKKCMAEVPKQIKIMVMIKAAFSGAHN